MPIGRPLSPVSVAGARRRSRRRTPGVGAPVAKTAAVAGGAVAVSRSRRRRGK